MTVTAPTLRRVVHLLSHHNEKGEQTSAFVKLWSSSTAAPISILNAAKAMHPELPKPVIRMQEEERVLKVANECEAIANDPVRKAKALEDYPGQVYQGHYRTSGGSGRSR